MGMGRPRILNCLWNIGRYTFKNDPFPGRMSFEKVTKGQKAGYFGYLWNQRPGKIAEVEESDRRTVNLVKKDLSLLTQSRILLHPLVRH